MGLIFNDEDGIDEKNCMLMYDGSIDFYKMVLETFLKEGTRVLPDLQKFYDADAVEDYRILVHGLKSSAASIGANDYSEVASISNEYIKAGSWDKAKAMHGEVYSGLEELIMLVEVRLGKV